MKNNSELSVEEKKALALKGLGRVGMALLKTAVFFCIKVVMIKFLWNWSIGASTGIVLSFWGSACVSLMFALLVPGGISLTGGTTQKDGKDSEKNPAANSLDMALKRKKV